MLRQPDNQRDDCDGNAADDAALVQPRIIVDKKDERTVATAAQRGFDAAGDDQCRRTKDKGQRQRLDPQPRLQQQRQEGGKDQCLPHPAPFFLRGHRFECDRGRIAAIGQKHDQQRPARRYPHVALVIAYQEAKHCQRKQDQRQRYRIEQEIAQPLRRDDIDIGIDQREQERALERHQHQQAQIADKEQVTHRRVVPLMREDDGRRNPVVPHRVAAGVRYRGRRAG